MQYSLGHCLDCGRLLKGRFQVGIGRCLSCFTAYCAVAALETGDNISGEDEEWLSLTFTSLSLAGQGNQHRFRALPVQKSEGIALLRKTEKAALRAARSAQAQRAKVTQSLPRCCVYMVQILQREHTVKIGQTKVGQRRLTSLRREYGPLRAILALPHPQPEVLEREVHRHCARYRLYEEASSSELFSFSPAQFRRILTWLNTHYEPVMLHPFLWQTLDESQTMMAQLALAL